MKALVVFESMFGNTQAVAEAIAEGLAAHLEVVVHEVGSAPTVVPAGTGLLVVGGPTHAFGMSRPRTRRDAGGHLGGHPVSEGIGLREWLQALGTGPAGTSVAAFDTRIGRPRIPGSAARAALRHLRRRHLHVLAAPESFFVERDSGPLLHGERERARRWGETLAAGLVAPTAGTAGAR